MQDAVQQFPARSAMKHALALNISDRSARSVLKLDLKMHSYKMLVTHQLTERKSKEHTRKEQCHEMHQQILSFATVFFSDEAHFHLCGVLTNKKFRYWAEPDPQKLYDHPLRSHEVTVWCAISELKI